MNLFGLTSSISLLTRILSLLGMTTTNKQTTTHWNSSKTCFSKNVWLFVLIFKWNRLASMIANKMKFSAVGEFVVPPLDLKKVVQDDQGSATCTHDSSFDLLSSLINNTVFIFVVFLTEIEFSLSTAKSAKKTHKKNLSAVQLFAMKRTVSSPNLSAPTENVTATNTTNVTSTTAAQHENSLSKYVTVLNGTIYGLESSLFKRNDDCAILTQLFEWFWKKDAFFLIISNNIFNLRKFSNFQI